MFEVILNMCQLGLTCFSNRFTFFKKNIQLKYFILYFVLAIGYIRVLSDDIADSSNDQPDGRNARADNDSMYEGCYVGDLLDNDSLSNNDSGKVPCVSDPIPTVTPEYHQSPDMTHDEKGATDLGSRDDMDRQNNNCRDRYGEEAGSSDVNLSNLDTCEVADGIGHAMMSLLESNEPTEVLLHRELSERQSTSQDMNKPKQDSSNTPDAISHLQDVSFLNLDTGNVSSTSIHLALVSLDNNETAEPLHDCSEGCGTFGENEYVTLSNLEMDIASSDLDSGLETLESSHIQSEWQDHKGLKSALTRESSRAVDHVENSIHDRSDSCDLDTKDDEASMSKLAAGREPCATGHAPSSSRICSIPNVISTRQEAQ